MIEINEIFSSIQGEGRFIGRPSTFVRLARCNLGCVWCDTAYTWRWSERQKHRSPEIYDPMKEIRKMTNDQLITEIERGHASHVIFTGGEPLLQSTDLRNVLLYLSIDTEREWTVEFETAGTLRPIEGAPMRVFYTVSPKLENSGNSKTLRFRKDTLMLYVTSEDAVFKFVACDNGDLQEIDWIVYELGIPPEKVYIMPEGVDYRRITEGARNLVPYVQSRGFNLTTRLHIYLWGSRRGV